MIDFRRCSVVLSSALALVLAAGCGARSSWNQTSAECGNGLLEAGEECDGTVGGTTCYDLGFPGGTLSCTASCNFSTTACLPMPGVCGDGICDVGETVTNCPQDCAAPQQCSPHTITGDTMDELVSDMDVPMSSSEAREVGVDLDGDGEIDNKLGSICSLLMSTGPGTPPDHELRMAIDSGALVTGLRLVVDSFSSDEQVLLQSTDAALAAPPPRFDGSDRLVGSYPEDSALCGSVQGGQLQASGGRLWLSVPTCFPGVPAVPMYLEHAGARGQVGQSGWWDFDLGGGITSDNVQTHLLPALQTGLNAMVAADPNNPDVLIWADLLEGNCESTIAGCAGVVAGQGDCVESWPPYFSLNEIRCNALVSSALAPDVDSNHDGVDDLLSVGWRVSTVPALYSPN